MTVGFRGGTTDLEKALAEMHNILNLRSRLAYTAHNAAYHEVSKYQLRFDAP
jgi:hypothetical protein